MERSNVPAPTTRAASASRPTTPFNTLCRRFVASPPPPIPTLKLIRVFQTSSRILPAKWLPAEYLPAFASRRGRRRTSVSWMRRREFPRDTGPSPPGHCPQLPPSRAYFSRCARLDFPRPERVAALQGPLSCRVCRPTRSSYQTFGGLSSWKTGIFCRRNSPHLDELGPNTSLLPRISRKFSGHSCQFAANG